MYCPLDDLTHLWRDTGGDGSNGHLLSSHCSFLVLRASHCFFSGVCDSLLPSY